MSWDLVTLEDVTEYVKNGVSIKQFDGASGTPITRIETISKWDINPDKCGYANVNTEDYKDRLLIKGDILLSHINSLEHLCKTAQYDGIPKELIHGMNLVCIRPNESIDSRFLLYALRDARFNHQAMRMANKSVNQASISVTNLKKLKISLPPLPEQKRIASILDATDALRSKRRQAIAMLDELLQATFLDMFGEHFSAKNYRTTEKYKISELVSYIDYRGKTPKKTDSGIPLITAKNVKTGYISEEPREYISAELYEEWMTRGLPKTKDVLFTTEAPLGNVALLGEYEKVVVGQRLVSLRCKEKLVPEYLMFALLQPYIKMLINQRSSGSTVRGIRTKEFYQIEIPTPPLTLQTQFAKIVEKVEAQKAVQQAHLAELDTLFASLQQRAFAGDL